MFGEPARLSKRCREVLATMRANEHDMDGELTAEGIECWLGYERTSRSVLKALVSCCFVSLEERSGSMERYTINDSGKRFLDGLPPYRDGDGDYHSTMFELEAKHRAALGKDGG